MSRTWKWIVGIIIGLVVVCAVVTLGFWAFGSMHGPARIVSENMPRYWEGGRLNRGYMMPWNNMPMRPYRFGGGFLPFGGFFRGFIGLGFLVLIGLGIAAFVLAITRTRKPAAAIASPATTTPAPPVEQAPAAIPARSCPNCQRPVDEGWSHCPYCGTALTPPE